MFTLCILRILWDHLGYLNLMTYRPLEGNGGGAKKDGKEKGSEHHNVMDEGCTVAWYLGFATNVTGLDCLWLVDKTAGDCDPTRIGVDQSHAKQVLG